MDAIETLRTRRSIRAYKPDPLKPEDLTAILDCGRLAPTGVGRQAWRFVAVTDAAVKDQIADIARSGKFIREAAACVAVFIGKDAVTRMEDAAAATTCMLLAAHALGYGTCWIGAYKNENAEKIHALLGAPDDYEMMTLFSLGVPAETPSRPKKSLEDVVTYNRF